MPARCFTRYKNRMGQSFNTQNLVHIRCGHDILDALRRALPGTPIAWVDPISEGPPRAQGLDARAEFLQLSYGARGSAESLAAQDRELEASVGDASTEDEARSQIVLWFEHDLFDQVILLYLLDWLYDRGFAHSDPGVRLIQIDRHASIGSPEQFRGLGQLAPEHLAALYPDAARPLQEADWHRARTAWQAWNAPQPDALMKLIESLNSEVAGEDPSALPFLRTAFERHLAEFPTLIGGLSRTETIILERLAQAARESHGAPGAAGGGLPPDQLFRAFVKQDRWLGLGDLMFWPRIVGLAFARRPLIRCEVDGRAPDDAEMVYGCCRASDAAERQRLLLYLTDFGDEVLRGSSDHVDTNGLDVWRGGVHLRTPDNVWRFNAQTGGVQK